MTDIKILSDTEIAGQLQALPGWSYGNNKISKELKFNKFMEGIKFIDDLAPIFDANDHHPDMRISYKKILFELQRFDVGGKVTDRDIMTAHIINDHYAKLYPENRLV